MINSSFSQIDTPMSDHSSNDIQSSSLCDLNINSIQLINLLEGYSKDGSYPVIIVNIQAQPQHHHAISFCTIK
jgi:hypothetical protein